MTTTSVKTTHGLIVSAHDFDQMHGTVGQVIVFGKGVINTLSIGQRKDSVFKLIYMIGYRYNYLSME